MNSSVELHNLGWLQTAQSIAARARERVPAYRAFLKRHGIPENAPFSELPVTDKASYLIPAADADLLSDEEDETFSVIRSSGASGRAFLWPQLRADYRWTTRRMRTFLEATYRIHEHRTVAIVALALGSWAGGDHYSWCLKNVALETPYPFTIFSPGARHDEVIDFLCQPHPRVEQFIVAICPSLIGYLLSLADSVGRPLPLQRMKFIVLGEAFHEQLRETLALRAGVEPGAPFMLSVYGSADTGPLGAESTASVALRQLLGEAPELRRELGIEPVVPHLFHLGATDAYLEVSGGELLVTRWQGVPIIRYNLHDSAQLLAWEPVRQAALSFPARTPRQAAWIEQLREAPAMPDLVAIAGRSDACVILGGTKLTEGMLAEAIRCSELGDVLTGVYRASLVLEQDRPVLKMDLQFRPGVDPDAALMDRTYHTLVRALGRVQAEFASDWENVYRRWDDDPSRRVLRLGSLDLADLLADPDRAIKWRSVT